MSIFRRNRVIYCGSISPSIGYKRKRFRRRFNFPEVNPVDVMGVVVAAVLSTAFVVAFLRWWFVG